MPETNQPQRNLRDKVQYLLWGQNPNDLTALHRVLLRQLQTAVLVVRDFGINQSMLRASALTYYTMLSLVPLLALTFALLKSFGVQNLLKPLIIEKLNVAGVAVAVVKDGKVIHSKGYGT